MLAEKLQEAAGNGIASTLYVDDVFSTYLYTGNGSTQTITNGIDLAGKGGLVWIKSRSAATDHKLTDTVRGATKALISDTTGAQTTDVNGLTAFSSTGFSIGTDSVYNTNAATYASWTFRKAAKFFDVVTWTGDGVNGRAIPHNLGIAPGMFFIKRTDSADDWYVYHRSLNSNYWLVLNSSAAQGNAGFAWTTVSSTSFTVPSGIPFNASGGSYVAYLFAHDTASDGIIQCGSFTTDASGNATVNLGWEPQYVMVKCASSLANWAVFDNMRGMPVGNTNVARLFPNTSAAETLATDYDASPNATGFKFLATGYPSGTFIYMAIRRPNKPPTSGTQVYYPVARSGTGATGSSTSFGQVTDLVFTKQRGSTQTWAWTDRLRGATKELTSAATTAETTYANDLTGFDIMTGFYFGSGASGQMNTSGSTYDDHLFRRAPGFFDVVCYTGTGSATTQAHNLGVAPEMMIIKERSAANGWIVYSSFLGASTTFYLNSDMAAFGTGSSVFNSTNPTSTNFSIGGAGPVGDPGYTYVAYLFATLAGISKVGSYTGNGTGQAIACGFSAGARFVLIKRTDAAGNWYTFDSARGLISTSSPYLLLNSTAAEVTGNNGVYASTGGFTLGATAITTTNILGASYIYLSVA